MLPKLPELPGEVWAAISDRIMDLDVLLRLICVKNRYKNRVSQPSHTLENMTIVFSTQPAYRHQIECCLGC